MELAQPTAAIAVTTRFFPLIFQFAFFSPNIYVNGYEARSSGWGRTVLPVTPGQNHVHVHTPYVWLRRMGPADYVVDVPPSGFVELEYKAPIWVFGRGALGPGPQRYPALAAWVAVTATLVLIMITGVVVYLIATLNSVGTEPISYPATTSCWLETVSTGGTGDAAGFRVGRDAI